MVFASAAVCRACDFVWVLVASDRECEKRMLRDILSSFVSVTRCAIVRCLLFTFVLWQSTDNRVAETWTFVAVDFTSEVKCTWAQRLIQMSSISFAAIDWPYLLVL